MIKLLITSVALGAPLPDSGDPAARLLTFDQVEARLGDPDFRLLDIRPRADYDAGHIPGAVWVDAAEDGRLAISAGWGIPIASDVQAGTAPVHRAAALDASGQVVSWGAGDFGSPPEGSGFTKLSGRYVMAAL